MQANVVINELAKRSHPIPFKNFIHSRGSSSCLLSNLRAMGRLVAEGWHEKWFEFLGFNKIVLICRD